MKAVLRERLVVGIEAATPAASVALATLGGELRASAWRERTGPSSPLLLTDLDRMLTELGATKADLAAVAVTLGPGGFTGLRVGLALAKTLAQALNIPLYGYSTLAMLAGRWPGLETAVVLLDARRNEVYVGVYAESVPLMPDAVVPLGSAIEQIMDAVPPGVPIVCLGNGAAKFWPELNAAFGPNARLASAPLRLPSAESVALAGAAALTRGDEPLDALEAMPVYLRASDAAIRYPDGVPKPRSGVPA